jgi:hypothetical protein
MVYVIASSGVHRNQASRNWANKAVIFTVAAVASGAASGAVLGLIGGLLPVTIRLALATMLAIAGAALACLELLARPVPPLQWDRETPQRWMLKGALRGSAVNGLALGFGGTTRIGVWLWYVVPLAALLFGRPILGTLIYGVYALVRGVAVWAVLAWQRALQGGTLGHRTFGPFSRLDPAIWLLDRARLMRTLSAATMLSLALAVLVVAGF